MRRGALPVRARAAQGADTIIVARDVKIGMRTGAPLHARIYRPAGKTLRPAVFSLEVDTSEARDRNARALAAAGYAVVIAAPRGGDDKHIGRDGYDAIEWINDQSWSDRADRHGGRPAKGPNAAWNAAREHPPHLAAILARTPARPLGVDRHRMCGALLISALSIAGSAGDRRGRAIETPIPSIRAQSARGRAPRGVSRDRHAARCSSSISSSASGSTGRWDAGRCRRYCGSA